MSLKYRSSGILFHISSLPSDYGIGKLGENAKKFVDFLKKSGCYYWQILPLSQTSYGDSPYQSFSIHAGNPYFIDFDTLNKEGILNFADYKNIKWGENPRIVDYSKIYIECYKVLRIAFNNFSKKSFPDFTEFCDENSFWLDDYALFMALKDANGGKPWNKWDKDLAMRKKSAIEKARKKFSNEILFYKFIQFEFFKQWKSIKSYANKNGIKIIGDMPIYVAYDSVEVWTCHELFQLDKKRHPEAVAGCPPDSFSPTGQLWGNPLYDWKYMKKTGYKWWKERINAARIFYDVLRIDHFRGFESYYTIPAKDKTAENGKWMKGPGYKFFSALKSSFSKIDVIAEDLGFITPEVRKLLDKTGYPGMKVLQFGFGDDGKSEYLPHNFKNTNCIAYTGTHDNAVLPEWVESLDKKSLDYAKKYFNAKSSEDIQKSMPRAAWNSSAIIAIAQMQDFLPEKSIKRMNTPSTLGNNWDWRALEEDFSSDVSENIYELNYIYNRLSPNIKKSKEVNNESGK